MKVEAPSYEEGVGVDGGWQGYALQIGARGDIPRQGGTLQKEDFI